MTEPTPTTYKGYADGRRYAYEVVNGQRVNMRWDDEPEPDDK